MIRRELVAFLALNMIISIFLAAIIINFGEKPAELGSFNSYEELRDFVKTRIEEARRNQMIYEFLRGILNPLSYFDLQKNPFGLPMAETGALEYSTTNIQVSGVDEVDTVKTDGRYIYVISGNEVFVVEAHPPESMRVISKITIDAWLIGLFVKNNRIAILKQEEFPFQENRTALPYWSWGVALEIYDTTDIEKPVLTRRVFADGSYVSSRMIGNCIYIVTSQPLIMPMGEDFEVLLPKMAVEGCVSEIPSEKIYYSNKTEVPTSYTIIIAVDVYGSVDEVECKAILTGYASCMFVSLTNIYVAMPRWNGLVSEGSTEIHRIGINGLQIVCEASGEVPGMVLNQFSMDEYNGYFRVATTTGQVVRLFNEATSSNHVYVLKAETLEIIGKLEGLAPGEEIYSARFMGNRCYLVTFRKVDPLFTIDLSNPEEPKVLGKLKIPGYSDYLHPYDENHLIGIGKETVEAEEGYFAWYQGLKISIFDVSNVTSPREVSKIVIGNRGTDSPILRDHHALLLDKERGLLVIPILEAKIFREKHSGDIPPWTHGEYVFQGAYVFNISVEGGIGLRGRITHLENQEDLIKSGYYFYSKDEVTRSLYIDNILYMISNGKIKANSLTDLSEISEVRLG